MLKKLFIAFALLVFIALGFVLFGVRPRKASEPSAVAAWNQHRRRSACTASEDLPRLAAKKGDHIICEDQIGTEASDHPPAIPRGYCEIFYTSGCPTCPVGWVLKTGSACEHLPPRSKVKTTTPFSFTSWVSVYCWRGA